MTIGDIAAVIAAVTATLTLLYTVRNNKGNLLKRIERKEKEIHDIEQQQCRLYGINGRFPMDSLYKRKERLKMDIENLKKKL